MSSHLLFLSHAAADSEAAWELKRRLERASEERQLGLKVWFDKDDLQVGAGWQTQLEKALVQDSTAFAVYVGSSGIVNWVDSEVRVALERARSEPAYAFIPILSRHCRSSDTLPAFVRQYQMVTDVENDPEQFAKLVGAATAQAESVPIQAVDRPFVGLRAFEEKDTHLFFGRDADAGELVERLKRTRLLMVVGDSGSGKSSLVKAGLIPRFRGGAFAQHRDPRADTDIWHVLETRPRSNPFDSLAESVAAAARIVGRSQADIRTLRRMIREQVPGEIADALRDGAAGKAKILLFVDQFEELFTLSQKRFREPYVSTLLHLAEDDSEAEFRVVLTMRRDYYNLCHEFPRLYKWLEDREERHARFSIHRLSDTQLRDCIEKPLALSGVTQPDVFVNRVLADVGDQPGELALLEMALTESWRRRGKFAGDMLRAYTSIGGTAGALANVADETFDRLDERDQVLAEASLIRLVRMGETGGTTRRTAARDEFTDDAWRVLQNLAKEDFGRLVYISGTPEGKQGNANPGGQEQAGAAEAADPTRSKTFELEAETAELSHEALVSQWPRFQSWLQTSTDLKRTQDRIIQSARDWLDRGKDKADLATGSTLEEGLRLLARKPGWLSANESDFLHAGRAAQRMTANLKRVAIATLSVLTIAASGTAWYALDKRDEAFELSKLAKEGKEKAESLNARLYDTLSTAQTTSGDPGTGLATMLMASASSDAEQDTGRLSSISGYRALLYALLEIRELLVIEPPEPKAWTAAALSPNGRLLATAVSGPVGPLPSRISIWNVDKRGLVGTIGPRGYFRQLVFSTDGTRIAALWSERSGGIQPGAVSVFEIESGQRLVEFPVHSTQASLSLTPNGERILYQDWPFGQELGHRMVYDLDDNRILFNGPALEVSEDGRRVLQRNLDGSLEILDLADEERAVQTIGMVTDGPLRAARLGSSGRLLVLGVGRAVTLWDVDEQRMLSEFSVPAGYEPVVQFAADQSGVVIWNGADEHTPEAFLLTESDGWRLHRLDHGSGIVNALISETSVLVFSYGWMSVWDFAGRKASEIASRSFGERASLSMDQELLLTHPPNGDAELWRIPEGRLVRQFRFGNVVNSVSDATISRSGRVMLVDRGGRARIFASGSPLEIVRVSGRSKAAAVSPNGRYLMWRDARLHVFDLVQAKELPGFENIRLGAFDASGRHLVILDEHGRVRVRHTDAPVVDKADFQSTMTHGTELSVSADGRSVVIADRKGNLNVWSIGSDVRPVPLSEPATRGFSTMSLAPHGGRLVVVQGGRSVRLYDTQTGELVRSFEVPYRYSHVDPPPIERIQFSPDGTYFVTIAQDIGPQIWSAEDGKGVGRLTGMSSTTRIVELGDTGITAVPIIPDGFYMFNSGNGKPPEPIGFRQLADTTQVSDFAFDPSGRLLLVSDSAGRRIYVRDAATGRELFQSWADIGKPMAVSFNATGTRLAVTTPEAIFVYRMFPRPHDLVESAKRASPRELSEEQRELFWLDNGH